MHHMTIDLPHLVLRTPSAVVAAVPHLIGYRPEHSLTIILMNARTVVLAANAPLPGDPQQPDQAGPLLEGWARSLAARCTNADAESAFIACFFAGPLDDLPAPVRAAVTEVHRHLEGVGFGVRDALVVVDNRWRSLLCASATCCPPTGLPVDPGEEGAVAAAFAYAGAVVAPSRAVLEHELDPTPGTTESARLDAVRDQHIEALGQWCAGAGDTSAAAQAVPWLFDVRVRDTLLWDLLADSAGWTCAADRLAELVRLTPRDLRAPVATVLAGVRWAAGDGARASIALECALAADPDYVLAGMLRRGVEAGLPPTEWVGCMRALPRGVVRHGSEGQARRCA